MNTISRSYILMMMAAGATIGAVAGLSNTSVSNTLIQLILTFVSGSAGLYYLKRDTLRKEASAMHAIGLIGIFFLGSFWLSYIPSSLYRYKGDQFYPWRPTLSLELNIALAEIHGHAQKLGISADDIDRALIANLSKGSSTCGLLEEDPLLASRDIAKVYGELSKGLQISEPAKLASEYISKQFDYISRELQGSDVDRKTAARASFKSAILALVAVSSDQSEVRNPSSRIVASATLSPQLAKDISEKIENCEKSPLMGPLLTIRAHAGAYAAIWKQSVSTKPSNALGTLEMRN
jgi:hypothetical protein